MTRQSIKNIHHYPAIYKCPNEILDKICSIACMDGGATSCSLSIVLKCICEVSKVSKYQTLLVKWHQLHSLTLVLHSLPLSAWRVVHLVIQSSNWQPHVQASCYDHFFDIDKNRVLALVAYSLHMLEVWANHAQYFLPITLPSLWVLTLGSSVRVEKHSKTEAACYPALKHFYLTIHHYDSDFNLLPVMGTAPALEVFKLLYCPCCQHAMGSIIQKPKSSSVPQWSPPTAGSLPMGSKIWQQYSCTKSWANHNWGVVRLNKINNRMGDISQSKYLGVWFLEYVSFSITKVHLNQGHDSYL